MVDKTKQQTQPQEKKPEPKSQPTSSDSITTQTTTEQPKKTRVLSDQTQAKKAPIPANIYVEFATDSDSGETFVHIWYNRRTGEEVGIEHEVEVSEITGIPKPISDNYTLDYSEKQLRDLIKQGGRSAHVYLKEGESTVDYTNSVDKLVAYVKERTQQ